MDQQEFEQEFQDTLPYQTAVENKFLFDANDP